MNHSHRRCSSKGPTTIRPNNIYIILILPTCLDIRVERCTTLCKESNMGHTWNRHVHNLEVYGKCARYKQIDKHRQPLWSFPAGRALKLFAMEILVQIPYKIIAIQPLLVKNIATKSCREQYQLLKGENIHSYQFYWNLYYSVWYITHTSADTGMQLFTEVFKTLCAYFEASSWRPLCTTEKMDGKKDLIRKR